MEESSEKGKRENLLRRKIGRRGDRCPRWGECELLGTRKQKGNMKKRKSVRRIDVLGID
jgi:hypothetical protein